MRLLPVSRASVRRSDCAWFSIDGNKANALIEVGDDRADRPPKRACHSKVRQALISSPGSNTSLAVLPPREPLRRSQGPLEQSFVSEHHRSTRRAKLEKGLASRVLRHPHFAHFKRVGRQPPISKAAHDQYATISEMCHVVQNRVFSQNARKPPVTGGSSFIPRKLLIINGGQRRDRTADAGLSGPPSKLTKWSGISGYH